MKHDIRTIGRNFQIRGELLSAFPYGSGHINDSYAALYDQSSKQDGYLFQRINHHIFKDPVRLMENVSRVCMHIHRKVAGRLEVATSPRVLTLIPAVDGETFYQDPEGEFWRVYGLIRDVSSFDIIENSKQAYESARAVGEFQKRLLDLPGERLHETIPDFHHTRRRYEAFEAALAKDHCGRSAEAESEILTIQHHKELAGSLLSLHLEGKIPERITHNDTKLNNVLLDDESHDAVCIIDLDTVMPGLAPYDFGELARTATSQVGEDETDLSRVIMLMEMFEALVKGYLASAGEFLNRDEILCLPLAAKTMTFENAVRFLTDFLNGDVYYKIRRERHNLERCRTLLHLLGSMEEQEEEMHGCVERIWETQRA